MAAVCSQEATRFVSSVSTVEATTQREDRRGKLELAIRAAGYVAVPHAEIDGMRRRVPEVPGLEIAPGFLKPVDEQTVCVFHAVAQAILSAGLRVTDLKEWGALAAPRFLGRVFDAATFHRFLQIGGGGVSVHLIPQQSQHAVSGAISVALGMQGPNFGIGGGPRSLSEGLLTAFSAYDPSVVPGLWVLLSEFTPEAWPDRQGKHTTPAVCHALALALSHEPATGPRLALEWNLPDAASTSSTSIDPPTLAELAEPLMAIARGDERPAAVWRLDDGFRLVGTPGR